VGGERVTAALSKSSATYAGIGLSFAILASSFCEMHVRSLGVFLGSGIKDRYCCRLSRFVLIEAICRKRWTFARLYPTPAFATGGGSKGIMAKSYSVERCFPLPFGCYLVVSSNLYSHIPGKPYHPRVHFPLWRLLSIGVRTLS